MHLPVRAARQCRWESSHPLHSCSCWSPCCCPPVSGAFGSSLELPGYLGCATALVMFERWARGRVSEKPNVLPMLMSSYGDVGGIPTDEEALDRRAAKSSEACQARLRFRSRPLSRPAIE